jgi:predicted membrane protein
LIFAEKKQDVDAIHEYLLLKGVEAVAIHGGKGNHIWKCVFFYCMLSRLALYDIVPEVLYFTKGTVNTR